MDSEVRAWEPTDEQRRQYDRDGYLILRAVVPREAAAEARGVIKNAILLPEPEEEVRAVADPMDPMGDTPEARAARFRKLEQFGPRSPLLWDVIYTGEGVLSVARHFLGDDLLVKFTSVFLKPARTGSATPWHQDNGLWRDGETEPFNFWMALDPATRENGCLQFLPGSHRGEIVPHVLYEDSIHGELPRERVRAETERRGGVHHAELEPGDCVVWHSSLWHYSPPNTSEKGRIGIAGVYSTPRLAEANGRFKRYQWACKGGYRCAAFPPVPFVAPGEPQPPAPWPRAE